MVQFASYFFSYKWPWCVLPETSKDESFAPQKDLDLRVTEKITGLLQRKSFWKNTCTKKKIPRLKFNPRLALIGLGTTRPQVPGSLYARFPVSATLIVASAIGRRRVGPKHHASATLIVASAIGRRCVGLKHHAAREKKTLVTRVKFEINAEWQLFWQLKGTCYNVGINQSGTDYWVLHGHYE